MHLESESLSCMDNRIANNKMTAGSFMKSGLGLGSFEVDEPK